MTKEETKLAKRREEIPDEGSPAWMSTFSDLMNLLLCFFVLLFASSTMDAEKLQKIATSDEAEEVSITYFVPDERKQGGAYLTITGVVTKIREYERDVIMEDGTQIPIDDIMAIEGNQFNETESN